MKYHNNFVSTPQSRFSRGASVNNSLVGVEALIPGMQLVQNTPAINRTFFGPPVQNFQQQPINNGFSSVRISQPVSQPFLNKINRQSGIFTRTGTIPALGAGSEARLADLDQDNRRLKTQLSSAEQTIEELKEIIKRLLGINNTAGDLVRELEQQLSTKGISLSPTASSVLRNLTKTRSSFFAKNPFTQQTHRTTNRFNQSFSVDRTTLNRHINQSSVSPRVQTLEGRQASNYLLSTQTPIVTRGQNFTLAQPANARAPEGARVTLGNRSASPNVTNRINGFGRSTQNLTRTGSRLTRNFSTGFVGARQLQAEIPGTIRPARDQRTIVRDFARTGTVSSQQMSNRSSGIGYTSTQQSNSVNRYTGYKMNGLRHQKTEPTISVNKYLSKETQPVYKGSVGSEFKIKEFANKSRKIRDQSHFEKKIEERPAGLIQQQKENGTSLGKIVYLDSQGNITKVEQNGKIIQMDSENSGYKNRIVKINSKGEVIKENKEKRVFITNDGKIAEIGQVSNLASGDAGEKGTYVEIDSTGKIIQNLTKPDQSIDKKTQIEEQIKRIEQNIQKAQETKNQLQQRTPTIPTKTQKQSDNSNQLENQNSKKLVPIPDNYETRIVEVDSEGMVVRRNEEGEPLNPKHKNSETRLVETNTKGVVLHRDAQGAPTQPTNETNCRILEVNRKGEIIKSSGTGKIGIVARRSKSGNLIKIGLIGTEDSLTPQKKTDEIGFKTPTDQKRPFETPDSEFVVPSEDRKWSRGEEGSEGSKVEYLLERLRESNSKIRYLVDENDRLVAKIKYLQKELQNYEGQDLVERGDGQEAQKEMSHKLKILENKIKVLVKEKEVGDSKNKFLQDELDQLKASIENQADENKGEGEVATKNFDIETGSLGNAHSSPLKENLTPKKKKIVKKKPEKKKKLSKSESLKRKLKTTKITNKKKIIMKKKEKNNLKLKKRL